jgi:hypothetical protein
MLFLNDLPYFIEEINYNYIFASRLFWKIFFYLIELRLDGIQLLFGILQKVIFIVKFIKMSYCQ